MKKMKNKLKFKKGILIMVFLLLVATVFAAKVAVDTGFMQIDQSLWVKGSPTLSTGLTLNVTGKIGAAFYCDSNGLNCKNTTSIGATGPAGPTGATGATGATGPSGITTLNITTASASTTASYASGFARQVYCPSGYVRTGCSGWWNVNGPTASYQGTLVWGNGCMAMVYSGGVSGTLTAYAYCIQVG